MGLFEIIIRLLVCMFEGYLLIDSFYIILNIRERLVDKLVSGVFLCAALIMFFINVIDNNYINLIGVQILFWSFVSIIFKFNIRFRFINLFLSNLIGSVFCYILFEMFIHIKVDEVLYVLSLDILMMLIGFLIYIVCVIVKNVFSKKYVIMIKNFLAIFVCMCIATISRLLSAFYIKIDFISNMPKKAYIIILIFLFIFVNSFNSYVFGKYSKNGKEYSGLEFKMMKQIDDKLQIQELFRKNEHYQELIHDTTNYLKTIGKLVESGKNERVINVLTELNTELEKTVIFNYSNNIVLNVLLSDKVSIAESMNVFIDIFVEPYVNFDQIKDIDLIAMIGNLMDNAIRGAGECNSKKEVKVRIFMQNENSILVVKVVNECIGNIQNENSELKSTKKENGIHGVGIKSVIHAAKKYDGYLEYFLENGKFTVIILLPV